jgi:S-adenosylmethionine:tRNA ribosyltransferase-isomerase
MDFEYYQVSPETANLINEGRRDKCLTAVGTTCVRTLEAIFQKAEAAVPSEGTTDLFIYPGYKFKSGINRLITNFHFPHSTLLMLVGAFAGTSRILKAYENAKEHNYRFYSFGDSMFILQPK